MSSTDQRYHQNNPSTTMKPRVETLDIILHSKGANRPWKKKKKTNAKTWQLVTWHQVGDPITQIKGFVQIATELINNCFLAHLSMHFLATIWAHLNLTMSWKFAVITYYPPLIFIFICLLQNDAHEKTPVPRGSTPARTIAPSYPLPNLPQPVLKTKLTRRQTVGAIQTMAHTLSNSELTQGAIKWVTINFQLHMARIFNNKGHIFLLSFFQPSIKFPFD